MSFYKIRVKGHLDELWSDWFDGLEITNLENGETMLSGCHTSGLGLGASRQGTDAGGGVAGDSTPGLLLEARSPGLEACRNGLEGLYHPGGPQVPSASLGYKGRLSCFEEL